MEKELYKFYEDRQVQTGKGSGIYLLDDEDGKYMLLIPTIEVAVPGETTNSTDVRVANSNIVTKLETTKTLEEVEVPVYMHRDTHRRLEKFEGKVLHLLVKTGEEEGYKFDGTLASTNDSFKSDDAMQGKIKLIPMTKPVRIDDVYPLCKPTVKFLTAVTPKVVLDKTTGTEKIAVSLYPEQATITALSDADGVATVAVSNGTATITGVAAGSTVVTLTAEAEGYAPWETTVHVVVPPTAA